MPADASGIAAYQATQKKSLSPREVEAMAFTKAALMMEDAQKSPDDMISMHRRCVSISCSGPSSRQT